MDLDEISEQMLNAIEKGDLDGVAMLISKGVDVELDCDGKTPLIWATMQNQVRIVQFLVEAGADGEILSHHGWSAMRVAAHQGYEAALHILIESGCSLASIFGEDDMTLLHVAVRGSSIVRLLLSYGANINAVNRLGDTPLMRAIEWGELDSVVFLLEAKPDLKIRNRLGHDALHIARECNNARVLEVLLEAIEKSKATPPLPPPSSETCFVNPLQINSIQDDADPLFSNYSAGDLHFLMHAFDIPPCEPSPSKNSVEHFELGRSPLLKRSPVDQPSLPLKKFRK